MFKREERPQSFLNLSIPVSSDINKYNFLEKLGEGTYGSVTKGQSATGEYVAIKKFIYKNEILHITTIREIKNLIHMSTRSKYLIELTEIIIDNDSVYAIFPFYPKTLENIKFNDFSFVKIVMKQILQGVADLHASKIIHRDLKLANIMWDDRSNTVKIIDLGMSRIITDCMTGTVSTLCYRAPELFYNPGNYKPYGYDIDIWSLGIIFMQMVYGSPLFKTDCEITQFKLLSKFFKKDFCHTFGFIKNKKFLDLLDSMLRWNPIERISAKEALQNDFFKDDDIVMPIFPNFMFS